VRDHRDLDAWIRAIQLAKSVYEVTAEYPRQELYGLAAQMRRSTVSIASNIAEGAARHGDKEFVRFLHMSLGSASELDTQIEISLAVGMGNQERLRDLQNSTYRVSQLTHGLIRYLRSRQKPLPSAENR